MQARLFEKMDAVASLVASGERDPNKVAALCSGLEGTELQAELSAISEQLSELAGGQAEIKELLLQKSARKSSVDLAKQDKVSSYIDIALSHINDGLWIQAARSPLRSLSQTQERALSEFEVVLDSVAPKPFARGGFGVVYMADYQGDEVVLKKLPMEVRVCTRRRGNLLVAHGFLTCTNKVHESSVVYELIP